VRTDRVDLTADGPQSGFKRGWSHDSPLVKKEAENPKMEKLM